MVHVERQAEYTRLRLESGTVHALDLELVRALRSALDQAVGAGSPPLILTGTGGSFSAGVDLFRIVDGGPPYVRTFLPELGRLFRDLFAYGGPLVAGINGHAVAGGALLAWCADMRVMAAGRGRIGVPELRVGVPFPSVAVEILRFATGGRGLQAIAYLGGTLLPDQAAAAGLVDEVVPADLVAERAQCLAASIARIPPASFRLTKLAVRRPYLQVMDASAHEEAAVLDAWCEPATFSAIRQYLEQTFSRQRQA